MSMSPITPEALAKLNELIRQIRAIPQLREKERGTYYLLGQVFLQIRDDGGKPFAELKKASGMGIDRFAVDDAPQQRKLVDEAKRRAAKLSDE
jgi:hypothetical protein